MRVHGMVEVVPVLADGSQGQSYFFRDIISGETNKSISSGQAGNFEVKFGLSHHTEAISEIADNDLCRLYLRRGDDQFTGDDIVMIGQVDRASSSTEPTRSDMILRGKDLTKQFITQIAYLQQIAEDNPETPDEDEGGTLAPKDMTYETLAVELLGCDPKGVSIKLFGQEEEVPGVSVGCFVKKFVTEPLFVDPDLLTSVFVDPAADELLLFSGNTISYQTLNAILEGVSDRPYWFWYVSERGDFRFKRFNWRDASRFDTVLGDEWMNDLTNTADAPVVGAVMTNTNLTTDISGQSGAFAIVAHEGVLHRYGMRFLNKQNVPYIYNQVDLQERAHEQLQYQFAQRRTSDLTVHGNSRFAVDSFLYVERLGMYYYVDSVQHRFKLGGENQDRQIQWNTNLGLTLGRREPTSYIDRETGYATIADELGLRPVPQFLEGQMAINRLRA